MESRTIMINDNLMNPLNKWIDDTYEKIDDNTSLVSIKDVLDDFKSSKMFLDLTKQKEFQIIGYKKKQKEETFNLSDWFHSVYEKTDDGVSFIYLSDLFEMFESSEFFKKLNKAGKRLNNMKRINAQIRNCTFLSENIKDRDTTFNKIRHRKMYIIGYKLRQVH
jgi:hypothetical protein